MLDTLTPEALTRRMNKQVLKWRVYKAQTDEIADSTREAFRSTPSQRSGKVAPWSEGVAVAVPAGCAAGPSASPSAKPSGRAGELKDDSSAHQAAAAPVVLVVGANGELIVVPTSAASALRPQSSGGRGWAVARRRKTSVVLTVTSLRTVLEKENV
jgi:hypothetical protein